jgi:hypothetical protein
MKNMDAADHLSCDKKNMLAYLYAVNAPVDLLFHSALENTATIYEKFYIDKIYRWDYKTSYLGESEWNRIGLNVTRTDELFNIDRFYELAKIELDHNRIVVFEAPKGGVPYFVQLMKKHNTPEVEYHQNHCYMLIGYNDETDELSFFDVFHGEGRIWKSDFRDLKTAYINCEPFWFKDSYAGTAYLQSWLG